MSEIVDVRGREVFVFLEVHVPLLLPGHQGIARLDGVFVDGRLRQLSDGGDPERQHLPARFRIPGPLAVRLLVQVVEPAVELLQVGFLQRTRAGDRDIELVDLVTVAHVDAPEYHRVILLEAGIDQIFGGAGAQLVEAPVETDRVQWNDRVVGHAVLVGHVRRDQPGGRVDRCRQRNHHLADPELHGAARDMNRSRSADSHHGEFPRVVSTLHRAAANEVAHVGIDDAEDPAGGLDRGHVQRLGDALLDGGRGRILVQRHTPPEKVPGVQVTQDHVGVAHGGLRSADTVSHGAGRGPRTLGAHLQQARLVVDPGDAAAARTDGGHPDLGRQNAVALEHGLVVALDQASPDQADLEGGAAHVGGQNVRLADQIRDELAAHHSGRGSGFQGSDGLLRRGLDAQHAAVGLHDEGSAPEPVAGEFFLKIPHVGDDLGADVRAENGRRRALVFAQERRDVAGAAYVDLGVLPPDHIRHGLLVSVVGDGPEQTDGNGLHTLADQPVDDLLYPPDVGVNEHRPLVVDPAGHFVRKPPRDHRLGLLQRRQV